MASQRIQGLNIKLSADTSAIDSALKGLNKSIYSTQQQLKDIDKLLKFDHSNITLLTQKQGLLTDAINDTKKKLEELTKAQELAQKENLQESNKKAWNELEKQIEATKLKLKDFNNQQQANNEQLNNANSIFKNLTGNALEFGDVLNANILSDAVIKGFELLTDAIAKTYDYLKDLASEYRTLEVYQTQFENNIRNTTGACEDEIEALTELAKEKSKQGVISKKAITSGYQELATYVQTTEAIEMLTDALVDMSAQQYGVDATEQSVRNIATTLGKALSNGDYSGLTRLGYGFNDAQKYVMEYGDELERVQVLSEVISSSIGGMNEKLAQTDAGKIFQAKNGLQDIKEDIGDIFSEIETTILTDIIPMFEPFLKELSDWLKENKDEVISLIDEFFDKLTSVEADEVFENIGELIESLIKLPTALVSIADSLDILLIPLKVINDIVGSIADFVEFISSGGEKNTETGEKWLWWLSGIFGGGVVNPFDNPYVKSSGFGDTSYLKSNGFGGVTLNANFTITNANNMDKTMAQQFANMLIGELDDKLGGLV